MPRHITRAWLAGFAALAVSHMALAAPAAKPPGEQAGAIWMAFALNKRLSPYDLGVQMLNGQAVLTGKVENQQDKDLASQIAQAAGDTSQVDNRLTIDPGLAERPPARQAVAQRIDDATLTATIRAKLTWNAATAGSDIQVSTDAGTVTLKGRALTADAKLLAGTLAGSTDGVTVVNNLISLSAADTQTTQAETDAKITDQSVSDAWITSKVKASFLYDRNLDALSIEVKVQEGVVSLSGEVASSEQKSQAVEVARRIRGVRGVDPDLLKVSHSGAIQ
ncbi:MULTISPECIES: BON domain-containing protein [unclassified Pseudomonas]|uniref:BON domain-containing protein n=1 Tax=unclassified Pseudomonas TaxID=196821 RepID=UPI000BCE7134|nr:MULTISPECIES: BON domain-containing protein [unclassified Pseudomonas]PVZ10623.1 osmotically-inducible protein OsmY [Pseudomonas sp. URIL14HWK12:I12]PVZ22049.1 osmotically-inducible protein OsmY [Pseudomonas sp. URIL14HWK12:I10]PVZ30868.1 osmotically-inducible protein OsmY [Pseudomonas sp. URIL14HWK12:I11]SNZ17192.1 Osmotically-inducible protein OsmY, contains BON domain [Pseudomonas sp. URIL14HWK12:I9]